MTEAPKKSVDKTEIIAQLADLSKLLGMIPSDEAVTVNEPMTQNSMALSEWFVKTRDSSLKLTMLIDKALELNLKYVFRSSVFWKHVDVCMSKLIFAEPASGS